MSSKPLTGLRVLLVEDDYYLASDAADAVLKAGGEIVGPFARAEEALEAALPGADVAVLDINLGSGPSFDLARKLRSTEIPIVFATGYDQDIVPEDLRSVRRLQKPFADRELIDCLSQMRL